MRKPREKKRHVMKLTVDFGDGITIAEAVKQVKNEIVGFHCHSEHTETMEPLSFKFKSVVRSLRP